MFVAKSFETFPFKWVGVVCAVTVLGCWGHLKFRFIAP